jgi:hypothetical protein
VANPSSVTGATVADLLTPAWYSYVSLQTQSRTSGKSSKCSRV